MKLRTRLGYLLLSKDPVIRSHKRVLLPDSAVRLPSTGFVHLHEATARFGECLTGKRIIFDRLAGKRFTLEGKEFWNIPEAAALAVLDDQ